MLNSKWVERERKWNGSEGNANAPVWLYVDLIYAGSMEQGVAAGLWGHLPEGQIISLASVV